MVRGKDANAKPAVSLGLFLVGRGDFGWLLASATGDRARRGGVFPSAPREGSGRATRCKGNVRIDFLYWRECPSYPEARALLRDVLETRGLEAEVVEHEVTTNEEAERLGFPGSPTIRVDGRDVDQRGESARPALTCRIYHLPDGRVSPVPPRKQVEKALSSASTNRQTVHQEVGQ